MDARKVDDDGLHPNDVKLANAGQVAEKLANVGVRNEVRSVRIDVAVAFPLDRERPEEKEHDDG